MSEEQHKPSDEQPPAEALDAADERLCEALRAAWAPAPLPPHRLEPIVEGALADPLAPPSEEELAQSERLRKALDGQGDHPDAALARALAAAAATSDALPEDHSQRFVEREPSTGDDVGEPSARDDDTDDVGRVDDDTDGAAPSSTRRPLHRGKLIYVFFGTAGAAAAAAAVVLLFPRAFERSHPNAPARAAVTGLTTSRSTARLFDSRFETGRTTERVDRIARARLQDLRSNRFARWGVR